MVVKSVQLAEQEDNNTVIIYLCRFFVHIYMNYSTMFVTFFNDIILDFNIPSCIILPINKRTY